MIFAAVTGLEMFHLCLGSSGLIGIVLVFFRTGKIVQKIESMDKKIDKLEDRFEKIDQRLSRVEGYLMGPQIFKQK